MSMIQTIRSKKTYCVLRMLILKFGIYWPSSIWKTRRRLVTSQYHHDRTGRCDVRFLDGPLLITVLAFLVEEVIGCVGNERLVAEVCCRQTSHRGRQPSHSINSLNESSFSHSVARWSSLGSGILYI